MESIVTNLFEGLPDELLWNVFEDSGTETLRSLRRTDRRFYGVASEVYERQQKKYRELNRLESGNAEEFDHYVSGLKRDFKKDYERHLYRDAFTQAYFELKEKIVNTSDQANLKATGAPLVPREIERADYRTVDIENGTIRELPSFSKMMFLRDLELSTVGIETLPEDLFASKTLRRLKVFQPSTRISFPDDVSETGINHLVLSFANQEIPRPVFRMESLHYLVIQLSPIREVPDEIELLQNLEVLIFKDTPQLTTISGRIGNLPNLRMVTLIKTGIRELPNEILNLPRLRRLTASELIRDRVFKELLRTRGGKRTSIGWSAD